MSPHIPQACRRPDERSGLAMQSPPRRGGVRRDPAPDPDELRLLDQVLARTLAPAPRKVAVRDLLRVFGTAASVVSADATDLVRTAGLSADAVSDLRLLRQLSVDLARTEACRRPVISSWTALLTYARGALAHQPREQFRALYLDRRNILIRDEFVADESAYRPDAVSPAGAGGLTQLMPATALELGVSNRFDPVESVRGGADYLARQLLRFGDVHLALAAYNAGPARVARLGRVPDFPETQAYVRTVIRCFLALTAGRAVSNTRQCGPEEADR